MCIRDSFLDMTARNDWASTLAESGKQSIFYPSAGLSGVITDPYMPIKPVDENINTPDKANAMFFASLPLQINDSHPDYAAMVIGNFMLGGGFLNSRLATRIRQKEGLSYGVGSWFQGSSQDDSGNFGAYAIYAPCLLYTSRCV